MKLTASQLRYMMALRKLDHGDKIRCTDLAKELCVKKPSVCGMLCRLENPEQAPDFQPATSSPCRVASIARR